MRMGILKIAGFVLGAALLSGCSMGGLLSGKRGIPTDQQASISTNNELAMPPDLTLSTPGSAPAAQAAAPSLDEGGIESLDAPTASPVTRKAAAATNAQGDIYEQYGISKLNADGSKKPDWQLREELRKAIIARKKKTNPGYGTFMNVGGLFSDN